MVFCDIIYYIMKLLSKKDNKKTEQQKVDERREEVLATGRKFKYPLQFTKHRVVVSTILIAAVVLGIMVVGGWLALYQFNMESDMLFRITKVLPVPVATVDETAVRFSDYLMFYRSSITSIERQSGQVDLSGSIEDLRVQYKRAALSEAEEYTYAMKVASEIGVEVSEAEVAAEFERHLGIGGVERSVESFEKIIEDNFGLTRDEYERMLYLTLVQAKVEQEADEEAAKLANKVESLLASNGGDYAAVADALGDKINYEETGGMVSSQNIDGGRASEASKLEPGQQSGRFVSMSGDGYYFVKLIGKTDAEVNFVSIKVPFTKFKSDFEKIREEGKIQEFVNLENQESDRG